MDDSLNHLVIARAKRLKADDAVALTVHGNERMVRFANNSPTAAKSIDETDLSVYLAKEGRRIVASTSNLDDAEVKTFVDNLFRSLKGVPANPEASPLPRKSLKFKPRGGRRDDKIANIEGEIGELAEEAIDSATRAGGERSAGAVVASSVDYSILTSSGTVGTDNRTSITLNIRSFSEGDASGHGLSCAARLSDFKPAEAGERAGENAKQMVNAAEPQGGVYQLLMSPTVSSNLISLVGQFASAFSVDAGVSFLTGMLGKKVASEHFSLTDHGQADGGLGGRGFDDEGVPTRSTEIIRAGVVANYLHNLTTAKKAGSESSGNAGVISPHPWNLEVTEGNSDYSEMVSQMRRGIILTSNWYTRFKNYRTGEFSTVPRDGTYLVENGKVVSPLKGLRVSDTLQRLLSSIDLLSREREWIEWWEVETPTLSPWILANGAKITKAYE